MEISEQDSVYNSTAFQSFFNSSPRSLLIKADGQQFTILAVSDQYLNLVHKQRHELLGKGLFEAFPGSQADRSEQVSVAASFWRVINTGKRDELPVFKYEIFIPQTGRFDTFYWSNLNEPVLDELGQVAYIINTTANVTQQINQKQALKEAVQIQQLNQELTATNEKLELTQNSYRKVTNRLQKSEAAFRSLLEQSPVAFAFYRGPRFIIEVYNEKVLEFWGRTAGQVDGLPLFEALPEASGQGFEELLTKVYQTGERFVANELPVTLQRNGRIEQTWINFIYEAVRDEDGSIGGIIVVCNEVTEQVNSRKQLEEIITEKTNLARTLRESEQRLQGILDTMAEGVSITDVQGQLVYANPMAQRLLGLTESEIKARTYDDPKWQNLRIDGSPLPDEEHPMSVMMQKAAAVYDQEIAVQPPDGGERFYISINAAPILDEQGRLTGGIGTFMDVTNRRKLTMQKDDFISVASHELKTPVTSLNASLQLLARSRENISPDMFAKLIAQANKSLDKLGGLIGELLDTTRISQGQLQLHKTSFNISDMLSECCSQLNIGGSHNLVTKGEVNLTIHADEQQISQVLVNFVNNAIKYAPDSPEITITVEKMNLQEMKISVTDRGPGIPDEKKEHLFDRFYRADYSGIQFSGLGLGLYICTEIIKKHGGRIGADSEVGAGSTFWFILPAAL